MKKLWALPILIGVCLLIYITVKLQPTDSAEEPATGLKQEAQSASNQPLFDKTPEPTPYDSPQPEDSRLNRLPDGRVEFMPAIEISRRIHSADTPFGSISEIDALLGQYRFAYKENPVGVENFEITEQLLGKNPKKIIFIAADSSALNGNELVDQWGTPYFFHPQSKDNMEIISAGPDKTLWTEDDIGHISQEDN